MLFFPIQQELDCISERGVILGKIRFDDAQGRHIFYQPDDVFEVTAAEQAAINERLAGLDAGIYGIPMQDDD